MFKSKLISKLKLIFVLLTHVIITIANLFYKKYLINNGKRYKITNF